MINASSNIFEATFEVREGHCLTTATFISSSSLVIFSFFQIRNHIYYIEGVFFLILFVVFFLF